MCKYVWTPFLCKDKHVREHILYAFAFISLIRYPITFYVSRDGCSLSCLRGLGVLEVLRGSLEGDKAEPNEVPLASPGFFLQLQKWTWQNTETVIKNTIIGHQIPKCIVKIHIATILLSLLVFHTIRYCWHHEHETHVWHYLFKIHIHHCHRGGLEPPEPKPPVNLLSRQAVESRSIKGPFSVQVRVGRMVGMSWGFSIWLFFFGWLG